MWPRMNTAGSLLLAISFLQSYFKSHCSGHFFPYTIPFPVSMEQVPKAPVAYQEPIFHLPQYQDKTEVIVVGDKGDQHHHHHHHHHHKHGHHHSHGHEHSHGHNHNHEHKHGHDHKHDHGHSHKHDHSHGHKHGHDHNHNHKHGHDHHHSHGHDHHHGHDHKHDHNHKHGHLHGHKHDHGHNHNHNHGHSHGHNHDHHHKHGHNHNHHHTNSHNHGHHHSNQHDHNHKHHHTNSHNHGHHHSNQHDHNHRHNNEHQHQYVSKHLDSNDPNQLSHHTGQSNDGLSHGQEGGKYVIIQQGKGINHENPSYEQKYIPEDLSHEPENEDHNGPHGQAQGYDTPSYEGQVENDNTNGQGHNYGHSPYISEHDNSPYSQRHNVPRNTGQSYVIAPREREENGKAPPNKGEHTFREKEVQTHNLGEHAKIQSYGVHLGQTGHNQHSDILPDNEASISTITFLQENGDIVTVGHDDPYLSIERPLKVEHDNTNESHNSDSTESRFSKGFSLTPETDYKASFGKFDEVWNIPLFD